MYQVHTSYRLSNSDDLTGVNGVVPDGINLAFAGGNGFPPEDSGGVQSSTHDLAQRLAERGGHPSVLAPLYGTGVFGIAARTRLKLSRATLVRDKWTGYPVFRSWFPDQAVADFVQRTSPTAAVVQCRGTVPIAQAFQSHGIPLIIYLRNVEFDELGGDLTSIRSAEFIANSKFTAKTYETEFGIKATVTPPTIQRSLYETETSGECVTFINPVSKKGLDRAIEIAAKCPDIPFLFVESWLLSAVDLKALQSAIRPYPNIRFEHRTNNIRSVYARTRILLAPSTWAEAWGRIASEAHCSGIPVVGSTQGGLPEAIGPGGVALDCAAPLDEWVATLRQLWSDKAHYKVMSDAARAYALRPEIDPELQFEAFYAVVLRAIERSGRRT